MPAATVPLPRLLLLAALGGVLGGGARALLGLAVPEALLVVNLTGSLALGALLARDPGARWRAFAGTGLLGGFTTWSALALEADRQLAASPAAGAALLVAHVGGGLLLAAAGARLGRHP